MQKTLFCNSFTYDTVFFFPLGIEAYFSYFHRIKLQCIVMYFLNVRYFCKNLSLKCPLVAVKFSNALLKLIFWRKYMKFGCMIASFQRSLFSQLLFRCKNILGDFCNNFNKNHSGWFLADLEIYKENFCIGKLVAKKKK